MAFLAASEDGEKEALEEARPAHAIPILMSLGLSQN